MFSTFLSMLSIQYITASNEKSEPNGNLRRRQRRDYIHSNFSSREQSFECAAVPTNTPATLTSLVGTYSMSLSTALSSWLEEIGYHKRQECSKRSSRQCRIPDAQFIQVTTGCRKISSSLTYPQKTIVSRAHESSRPLTYTNVPEPAKIFDI